MTELRNSSSSQDGFSLVELMIALTLSIILLAGVIEIFLSNKKAFEITTDLGVLQESGRIGSAVMSESIRMAGHWGGVEPTDVKTAGSMSLASAPGGCNAGWVFAPGNPVQGFEGATSIGSTGLPANCIAGTDYVPGSDLLVVRYADASELFSDAQIGHSDNASRFFSRVAIGQQAQLFQGTDASTALSAIASDNGVYNFGYRTELYFLRQCSIKSGSACTASDDGIPTLTRLTLTGNSFAQQALVEGIEQMQFDYGVDQDGDQRVDSYETARDISDWTQVMSVRMSLVARASTKDLTVDEENKEYLLVGDMAAEGDGYTVAAADKHYRRKQYTREIHLRNRSRI